MKELQQLVDATLENVAHFPAVRWSADEVKDLMVHVGQLITAAETERARQAEAELRDMLRVDIPSLKAERDAALAAIERVRLQHHVDEYTVGHTIVRCVCEEIWPCSTIAALDEVSEPEWEYIGRAFRHDGSLVYAKDHLTAETSEEWRERMSNFPRVDVLRRRKAGPWLPVEGESK